MWARLHVHGDPHIELLDLHGQYHGFNSEEKSRKWLQEKGYEDLRGLIKEGAVSPKTVPPTAASDFELIPRMTRRGGSAAPYNPEPDLRKRKRRWLNAPLLVTAIFIAVVIMAVKNSNSCQDRPGGFRIRPFDRGAGEKIIPCEMECCPPEPWAFRCTGRCP
jgi:hypothetical protein